MDGRRIAARGPCQRLQVVAARGALWGGRESEASGVPTGPWMTTVRRGRHTSLATVNSNARKISRASGAPEIGPEHEHRAGHREDTQCPVQQEEHLGPWGHAVRVQESLADEIAKKEEQRADREEQPAIDEHIAAEAVEKHQGRRHPE
eukprot:scaffold20121_cov73-Isochrysis_galbana.AAC.1